MYGEMSQYSRSIHGAMFWFKSSMLCLPKKYSLFQKMGRGIFCLFLQISKNVAYFFLDMEIEFSSYHIYT